MNNIQSLQIIDGKVYSTVVQREMTPDELMAIFRQGSGTGVNADEPPLPMGCRWHFENDVFKAFVIEVRPALLPMKHVNWRRAYRVAFPWQYFVLVFNKSTNGKVWHFGTPMLGWSKNRVLSLKSRALLRPSLPNVYSGSYQVCVGTTAPESTKLPNERAEEFISGFYTEGSEFNDDLDWNYPGGYRNVIDWARASNKNPFCFMNWDWYEGDDYSKSTLESLINMPAYDANGNALSPVTNLDDVLTRAAVTGRRPW